MVSWLEPMSNPCPGWPWAKPWGLCLVNRLTPLSTVGEMGWVVCLPEDPRNCQLPAWTQL